MSLNSPNYLWLLGFIALVILMYLLKQKFKQMEISSTYLWDIVLKNIEVNTPWQKFKNNILLFMQILLISLIVLSLANPFINLKGENNTNVIIVIDNTGSMNTLYNNKSRLDAAKDMASDIIKSLSNNSSISIVSSGKNTKVEVNNTKNKTEALSKIKNIKPSDCYGNLNEDISFIKSMQQQMKNSRVYIYTDININMEDIDGELISLSSQGENVSLDYIAHSEGENGLEAVVRASNRSSKDLTREIGLYNSKKLIDIKSIKIKPHETKTLYFKDIPKDCEYIYAEITEKDILNDDNMVYDVVKHPSLKKVLLITKQNYFIENALLNLNNIELYKSNSKDNIDEGYDVYILDNITLDKIPPEGNILFINSNTVKNYFSVSSEQSGGRAEFVKTSFTKYLNNNFIISKFKDIKIPFWGQEFLKVNDKTAGLIGKFNGRKICAISFDIHNSDFPLSVDFPIFINNVMEYFIGTEYIDKTSYLCGDAVNINASPDAKEIYVDTPAKDKVKINPEYPVKPFENTYKPGIYELVQNNISSSCIKSLFAVNYPSEKESNMEENIKSQNNAHIEEKVYKDGISIKPFLLLLVLILMIIEWKLYADRY